MSKPAHRLVLGLVVLVGAILAALAGGPVAEADGDVDQVSGALIEFDNNGGWCWFQDERVLVDPVAGSIIFGSVANHLGPAGSRRDGDINLGSYQLADQWRTRSVLHDGLGADDHNAPALLIRPDGRYLAMYTKHAGDRLVRYRVSRRPHDATSWRPEQVFRVRAASGQPHPVTYSNLIYLAKEKRLYDFVRADDRSPNIMVSSDQGDTWRWGGYLTRSASRAGYVNGYFKYTSNGVDRIDVVATEHHPRSFNTSIYHGYIKAGMLHRSDGTVVDRNIFDARAVRPDQLTPVFRADPEDGTQRLTRAWPSDIQTDASGRPVIVFSARATDVPVGSHGVEDHRFLYATYLHGRWVVRPMAKAGPGLYDAEVDYTGLVSIDPQRPNQMYVSTPVNPITGQDTPHREIYRGMTPDHGRTWRWRAITSGSMVDNIRPVVPSWRGGRAVLWLRGSYQSMYDYDLAVVGLVG